MTLAAFGRLSIRPVRHPTCVYSNLKLPSIHHTKTATTSSHHPPISNEHVHEGLGEKSSSGHEALQERRTSLIYHRQLSVVQRLIMDMRYASPDVKAAEIEVKDVYLTAKSNDANT